MKDDHPFNGPEKPTPRISYVESILVNAEQPLVDKPCDDGIEHYSKSMIKLQISSRQLQVPLKKQRSGLTSMVVNENNITHRHWAMDNLSHTLASGRDLSNISSKRHRSIYPEFNSLHDTRLNSHAVENERPSVRLVSSLSNNSKLPKF